MKLIHTIVHSTLLYTYDDDYHFISSLLFCFYAQALRPRPRLNTLMPTAIITKTAEAAAARGIIINKN